MCLAQGPQCSDASEARTHGLSVSNQALYHCAHYTYADVSSEARGVTLDLRLHLHPYFVYVSSKSYGESMHLH